MSKEEAIEAMKEGKKLTHKYFTKGEWVKSNQEGTRMIMEDEVECSPKEFWRWRTDDHWEKDWSIWNR